ncbi:hypothetical protein [Brevibacterium sp. XM4083]|uniref:hypothetical protein n=1 Tax=Brevibacterium sp. XM4083 TaxID=2583238 RepID=UPI00202E7658|nr:hypothetical protein [Brevibacterium sp. XM4083]MCM1013447.1 hypothetical protein [Brevibacterium sp. XM4083]
MAVVFAGSVFADPAFFAAADDVDDLVEAAAEAGFFAADVEVDDLVADFEVDASVDEDFAAVFEADALVAEDFADEDLVAVDFEAAAFAAGFFAADAFEVDAFVAEDFAAVVEAVAFAAGFFAADFEALDFDADVVEFDAFAADDFVVAAVLVEVDDPALFVAAVLRVEPAPPPLALSFFVVGLVVLEGSFVMAVLLTGNRRAPGRRPRSRRLRCRPGRRAYSKCDGDNLSQFSASVADGSANV